MAEIVISTKVEAPNISALQALTKELKAAKAAALNGDGVAAKRVAELTDKLDDLKDATRTLQGSGIERVQNSFALLGEGFKNFDFDKIKIGFSAVGAAMKAIPIFLVIEGIKYLIENFQSLSEGTGPLAKALQFVGEVIDGVKEGLKVLSDELFNTTFQFEDAANKMIESTKKVTDSTVKNYEFQIKAAQAAGKNTIDLERKKFEAMRESAFKQILYLEALKTKTGELTGEQKKQYEQLVDGYRTASQELKLLKIKDDKEAEDKAKEAAQKAKESAKERKKEELDRQKDRQAREADVANALIDKEEKDAKLLKAQREKRLQELNDLQLASDKREVADFEAKEKEKERIAKESDNAINQAKIAGLNAAQGLADLVGQIALNRAKGNAQKEISIRKQMFNIDKAFNAARAVQDGIRSVQAALTIPPPGGQILAAINAATAAVNVGKILATKFDGGNISIDTGGGGGSSGGGSTVSSGPIPNPGGQAQGGQTQPFTKLDDKGNVTERNVVWVSVKEINDKQRSVARISEQAKF